MYFILNILQAILQLHFSGQENTIKLLSRKFRNVRTNFSLVLHISVEQEVHKSKRQPGEFKKLVTKAPC